MSARSLCQSCLAFRKALVPSADYVNTRLPAFIQLRQNFVSKIPFGYFPIEHQQRSLRRPNAVSGGLRSFHSSPVLKKKKEKPKKGGDPVDSEPSKADAANIDAFDLSQLHDGIHDAVSRLKADLSKLRSGGRFNSEAIENLRVQLVKGAKETVKLGQLAQVVPKGGRIVTILVGEEDVS